MQHKLIYSKGVPANIEKKKKKQRKIQAFRYFIITAYG